MSFQQKVRKKGKKSIVLYLISGVFIGVLAGFLSKSFFSDFSLISYIITGVIISTSVSVILYFLPEVMVD